MPAAIDWVALRREVFDVFTPGPPIDEYDLFVGRRAEIQRLQDIVIEQARHAIIFGERGVGKTSLASVFYKPMHSATQQIIVVFVNADKKDDFDSLWRKVFRRIKRNDGVTDMWADQSHTDPLSTDDVIVELSEFGPNQRPIFIIDEYDRIENDVCRTLMTDVIKGLVNYRSIATLILVGVADNILQLVRDHASISRSLIEVPMERMSADEIRDITVGRVRRLRMRIIDDAVWRITYFSGGLPFYAHSLGKHAALNAISKKRVNIIEDDILDGMDACMADVDYIIRESYTRATERIYRKSNIFPQVLAACALAENNDLGQFVAVSIEEPLSAIIGEQYKVPSFSFHLNEMCGPERGNVLRKTGARRTYQFHFAEPAMQPYVLMKSLKEKVISKELLDTFAIKRQRVLSI